MTSDRAAFATLATICDEAARLHGDDWPKVYAHVRERVGTLPPTTRRQLETAMERLLGFEPPPPDAPQVH